MGALTVYAISAAIALSLCYIIYMVCLSGATFHRFNRVVLISVYAVALVAPFAAPMLRSVTADTPVVEVSPGIMFEQPMAMIADVPASPDSPEYWLLVPMAYVVGLIMMLGYTLFGIVRIIAIVRGGEKTRLPGAVLVTVDRDISPFSWGRWIVVSRQDAGNDMIINHELQHVRSMHTIDMMLAQMFVAFNWFNPCAWMMRRDLSAQHEYAVDEAMLDRGVDARSYQMLIVRKAVGATMGPLANCLHNSQLKNRVKMMIKIKSKSMRRLLAAAIAPAAFAAMAVINSPAVAATLDKMDVAPADQNNAETLNYSAVCIAGNNENADDEIRVIGYGTRRKESTDTLKIGGGDMGKVYYIVDGNVVDESAVQALDAKNIESITVLKENNTVIIETKDNAVQDDDDEGVRVVAPGPWNMDKNHVNYIVDGKISGEVEINQIGPENIESVTVLKDGDTVIIDTKDGIKKAQDGNKQDKEQIVVVHVEKMPQYPGGEAEMFHKLCGVIRYPEDAFKDGVQGKAVVSFAVHPNGKATDFKIEKSAGHESLDKEAVRACKAALSEGWIPGLVDSKPATVNFAIPVTFRLK